jgi:hypothetical protein
MTSEQYAELSRRHAGDGNLRMAQLAAWAGDVHVLEDLLWQNGLAQAPDPAGELAAVGESVAASVEELARALEPGAWFTAREVVEAAREAMVTTFDESVHGLLADRFGDLGQLDEHRASTPVDRAAQTSARLGGRAAAELAAELRTAAGDCATMAGLLEAAGEAEAAVRLTAQADAAAFEAHLVSAAIRAGDDALVTVDLRWDLVADDDSAPASRRDRFAGVLGSAERDVLLGAFEPVHVP